MTNTKNGIQ